MPTWEHEGSKIEVGGNPRDVKEKTEEGCGETVESCKKIFFAGNWEVWNGPSRFYRGQNMD